MQDGPVRAITFLFLFVLSAYACGAPSPADDAYLAAGNLLASGRYSDAAEAYDRFANDFPEHPRAEAALFRASEALFRAGRLMDALSGFKRLKTDPRARFRESCILYLSGRAEEAARELEALLKSGDLPAGLEGPSLYFLGRAALALAGKGRADLARRGGRASRVLIERARERLERAAKDPKVAPYALLALGDMEAAKGPESFAKAVGFYRRCLEKAERGRLVPECLFRIGELERLSGRSEEALASYRRLIQGFPRSLVAPYAHVGAAWAAFSKGRETGDMKPAIELASAAAGLAPESGLEGEARYVEGTAHLASGDFAAAAERLSGLLGRRGPWPEAPATRRLAWAAVAAGKPAFSSAELKAGKTETAGAAAEAVAQLGGDLRAEANLLRGELALRGGDTARALRLYEAAEKTGPPEIAASAAFRRGQTLLARGEPDRAAKAFDGFLERWGSGERKHGLAEAALLQAARAHLVAGSAEAACVRFKKALELYGRGPELLWGAALAEYMRGDYRAMARYDGEILQKHPRSELAPGAAYWAAWAELAEGRLEEAAKLFRKAASLARPSKRSPGNPEVLAGALLELASILDRTAKTDEALKVALELVRGPAAAFAPAEAVVWAAERLIERGKQKVASEVLRGAAGRAKTPRDKLRLKYALAESLRSGGKLDEALEMLEEVASSEGATGAFVQAARLGKARVLLARKRPEEAEVLLEDIAADSVGWSRAAAYLELGSLRLRAASASEGGRRKELASRAVGDLMRIVLLYEPEGPGEGARLCAGARLGAADAYAFLGRYGAAREQLEYILTHPLFNSLPEAGDARRKLQDLGLRGLEPEEPEQKKEESGGK